MRLYFLLLATFYFIHSSFSQPKLDTLTNGKIIAMVKNGVSDLLITKSISSTRYWRFDLSSDSIIVLKKNKVSDTVIVIMFDKETSNTQIANYTNINTTSGSKQPVSASNNKSLSELTPGIYFESNITNTTEYLRLNMVKPSTGVRSNPILNISVKREFIFLGKIALTKIKSPNPVFYLVVGSGYDGVVYQPTQFVIIHADQKKSNRIISGKPGTGYGATRNFFQFDSKDLVTPIFNRINDTLYKVTFEKKLPEGNYFFGPTSSEANSSFLEFDITK